MEEIKAKVIKPFNDKNDNLKYCETGKIISVTLQRFNELKLKGFVEEFMDSFHPLDESEEDD